MIFFFVSFILFDRVASDFFVKSCDDVIQANSLVSRLH